LGGIAMLRALGYHQVKAYHMNEGHSALITLALMEEQTWGRGLCTGTERDREAVRQRCIFTTHTPVVAGHDAFPVDIVRQVLGDERTDFLLTNGGRCNGSLNMSNLALDFSRYVNGVSMRHEKTSRNLFSTKRINAVTNGVHAATWASPAFRRVYDQYIPEWRSDNLYLRYAIGIPLEAIWQAHTEAKKQLVAEVERRQEVRLDSERMVVGFARRATGYKRTDLLFYDLERLTKIAQQVGPIQIICGGKAHPRDDSGRELIKRIFKAALDLKDAIKVVYLEEYDIELAKYLCSGVDLWLNTPLKPYEASGTSGMKAALNGIPSLSVLDGWWIEGHLEGVTGWSIGEGWSSELSLEREVDSLYDKLENSIVRMFYQQQDAYKEIMRSVIAINASFFNAQRMVAQYLANAYYGAGDHVQMEAIERLPRQGNI
jgi:starch phosphorylase